MRKNILSFLTLALVVVSGTAHAHGGMKHDEVKHEASAPVVKEQKPWGIAGDRTGVSRTVTITMADNMRFTPDTLRVKRGDTVRLELHNDGRMLHEMVIGTQAVLDEHAALMRKFPDMEHDEPYMAHVEPGETGEIVWHFNRAGDFDFACLIPGHYEAGMVGRIIVRP